MPVTISLKPAVEAELVARARAAGMSLADYLLSIVEGVVFPPVQRTSTPEERAVAFEAWSAQHRLTPPLSDHAVSREAMYEDRDNQ
jgi:hypothetical protein